MHKGSRRFHELLTEIAELHDRKQQDYGTENDPFANVRGSEEFGTPAWLGALMRLNDKVQRLKSLAKKGYLANESVDDSLRDIAVYAIISLVLYEEKVVAFANEPVEPSDDWFGPEKGKWLSPDKLEIKSGNTGRGENLDVNIDEVVDAINRNLDPFGLTWGETLECLRNLTKEELESAERYAAWLTSQSTSTT